VATPTEDTSSPAENKSENSSTQLSLNDADSALKAYKAVLENKSEFYSTDTKKNIFLDDFLTNKEIFEAVFKAAQFTTLDMDGDKIPEVVLELSIGDDPISFEILHYMNNTVYGYNIVYRGLEQLKADGTFWSSGGTLDNSCEKLRFESNTYKTDSLGYSKSSYNNDAMTISYFINNKPVTEESFRSFADEQNAKPGPAWYEFSQKNIDTELSVNQ
jgi:hypothetical protein